MQFTRVPISLAALEDIVEVLGSNPTYNIINLHFTDEIEHKKLM